MEVLRELTLDEVNKIKIEMKKEWPQTICYFYFIENYLKWKEICPETEIKFFDFIDNKVTNNLIAYLPVSIQLVKKSLRLSLISLLSFLIISGPKLRRCFFNKKLF